MKSIREKVSDDKTTQPSSRACLLLPLELFVTVLSFCDGMTISTVMNLVVASNEHRFQFLIMMAQLIKRRLDVFRDRLALSPTYMPRLMRPFLDKYNSAIQQEFPQYAHAWTAAVRYLSTRLAVLDYFESGMKQQRDTHEWLVWCGTIRLVHSSQESQGIAQYSPDDVVERHVQVEITSPCWYPSLVCKWSRGMRQCNHYASDFCRRYNRGGQVGHPPTHVARIVPMSSSRKDSLWIQEFNTQKRSGDYANPWNDFDDLILHDLFLASPTPDADRVAARMSWATGNVKASLHSIRTAPPENLFGFWTDMTVNDKRRTHDDFTVDILELQTCRNQMMRDSRLLTRRNGGSKEESATAD